MKIVNGKVYADVTTDLERISDHIHSAAAIYPVLATGVTLTKGAGAWAAYPEAKTEIVPVDTITSPFDIHWIDVNTISANGQYTITLYSGLAGAEVKIAEVAISRTAVFSQEGAVPVITPIVSANSRISAAISSSNVAADTLIAKVGYHTY